MVVPVSVAVKVGVRPLAELLFASFSVIVMVAVDVPSATMGPVPVIVELAADTVPEAVGRADTGEELALSPEVFSAETT